MRRRALLENEISFDPNTGRAIIKGYEVVDLDLPSGLLWATCNVNASTETAYGNYYMYGMGSKIYTSTDSVYGGTEDPLATSADTATQVMGSQYRMPTRGECQELIDNTRTQWVTINGVKGRKFICKTNTNKYVFFPACGCYYNNNLLNENTNTYVWTSTPYNSNISFSLDIYTNRANIGSSERKYGFSVRGVHNSI